MSSSISKSVVYGWTGLTIATGFTYYYAKKTMDAKRKDPAMRNARGEDKITRGAHVQARTPDIVSSKNVNADPGRTPLDTTASGEPARASMRSSPTGVDTPDSGPRSTEDR